MPGDLRDAPTSELLEAIRRPPREPIARQAIAELIRRYGRYVFALTLRFCGGNRDRAEDAFQTAFLRFLEAWTQHRFADPIRSFPSLLLRLARNAAVDSVRVAEKTAELFEASEDPRLDLERRMTVQALMERLPVDQQRILFETVIAGRSSEEAAQLLHLSPEAVRARKSRALKRLRKLLEPEERLWSQILESPDLGRHK